MPTSRPSKDKAPVASAATSTSRSLLARVKERDAQAWDRLVTLYAPLVYHWCRRMQLPEQEMADVFQDVFQSVAAHIHQFRRDRPGDTFRGWLRTITHSKVCDHYRRQEREPKAVGGSTALTRLAGIASTETNDDEAEEPRVSSDLYRRALELIREHFAERTWRAFWAMVIDGRAAAEVAQELGMEPGAVRVAKCRVLHRLRRELGDLID